MIIAAGAIFISTETKRILLNFRSDSVSKPNCFGFWGGKIEKNEKILEGLTREIKEEVGFLPEYEKIYPIDVYCSPDGFFRYYSFVILTEKEFIPIINSESSGYIWCTLGTYPKPLHNGAKYILLNKSYIKNIRNLATKSNSKS